VEFMWKISGAFSRFYGFKYEMYLKYLDKVQE
jgi:hypothetical protein